MNTLSPATAFGSVDLTKSVSPEKLRREVDALVEKHQKRATQYKLDGIILDVIGDEDQRELGRKIVDDLEGYIAAQYNFKTIEVNFTTER